MNKEELISHLEEWNDSGEHEKIIAAVMALPDSALDDEILGLLARAYNSVGEYKKAIAVLESQRGRMDNNWLWHYRMGYALFHASSDEECEGDEVLRRNILDRARCSFARCMNMNPPEDVLEDCDVFIEMIEDDIDDDDEPDEDAPDAEMYDEEEMDTVEDHIKEYFGEFPTVYHEIHSPDVHIDICIIPPTTDKNYYTLITMGMGAHIMDIPEDLDPQKYGRAELLICLPPDWRVGESDEEWFWPITLLKNLARLPINCETWLGWGHSVDNQQTFSRNTELCGSVLIRPEDVPDGADTCELPNGDSVTFFEVIPVYREEMSFKIDHDTESLLERMNGVSHITDITRPNCCEGYERADDTDIFAGIADTAYAHIESIKEKQLPLDDINGCNHMAIYLRWCIEHGLVSDEFVGRYPNIVDDVMYGVNTDLRRFIMDELDGLLLFDLFTYEGASFTTYYYGSDDVREHSFPCDVDSCAEDYFGTEKYNCAEFKDEAYLFVPFNEDYYERLSKYIERSFADFDRDFTKRLEEAAGSFSKMMNDLTGCPCTAYNSANYGLVREELKNARLRGASEGFYPLLIACDPRGVCTNQKGLTEFYSDIGFAPICIAEIPAKGKEPIQEWLRERYDAAGAGTMKTEELAQLQKKFEKRYGEAPWVVSLTELYPIFLEPIGDGWFTTYEPNDDAKKKLILESEEDDADLIPSMINFLGCRCRLFAAADDDEELNKAYAEASARGKKEGFTPVFIVPDRMIWHNMMANTVAADINAEYGYDPEKVEFYRKMMMSLPVPNGEKILSELIDDLKEELEEDGGSWDDLVGYIANGDPLRFLLSLWSDGGAGTRPAILAEIPVTEPWKVFAYVPFGAWGSCPDTQALTAIAKYWYEKHGAVPAVIAHNELNFAVEEPVSRGKALPLAVEMYGFCPDIVTENGTIRSIGELADGLRNSTVWHFHWE